ncbi:hypothetical protein BD310DRAFT_882682 [Dichomitus squalens]|uniref:Uncharacterized protein n=1 Tax=Dichomitus squalens TaxID=114155 RepID=A0A4Q9PPV4_9APHY|nr:hypothetical protein BD310DRAFT_882682 [Dichomitus squalens]
MILLDGLDKQDGQPSSKLVAEASPSIIPVARVHTPTPSLPDYEASQAQLRPTTESYSEIKKKRTRRRKCKRITIIVLAAYFVLTTVIGIPIIVVKAKQKLKVKSNPYTSWGADTTPVPPKSVQLGHTPLRISAAKSCNTWNVKDRPDGPLLMSQLEYHIPVNASVFLSTNITYANNATYLDHFTGSLLVAVNDDVSVSDGVVYVTMHHTNKGVGNATNVCLMETNSGNGVYIFAPTNLDTSDALNFNVTLLLPQNGTSPRNIESLMCHLPHFQHTYQQLDPKITFNNVVLGGALSGVYVESLQANSATVKASAAEVRGWFKVASQLSLETVSAPINAEVDLFNDGGAPTFMTVTTGNSPLNVNVTLHAPPPANYSSADADDDDDDDGPPPPPPPGPQFVTYAETFNAPLNVAVVHASDSPVANMRLRAVNNIGTASVSLDSRYEGTFDVNTMFAQANVLTWDGTEFDNNYDSDSDGDDDGDPDADISSGDSASATATSTLASAASSSAGAVTQDLAAEGKVRIYLPPSSTSSGTAQSSGRCLEYDLISPSEISGWVGIPPRPLLTRIPGRPIGNQSHVDVVSSLTGAQLILQP